MPDSATSVELVGRQGVIDETPARRRAVAILDVDPDLAADMDAERARSARTHAIAAVETLQPGEFTLEELDIIDPRCALGLLVLDGLLSREVAVGTASFTELIGDGEILRPWDMGTELTTEAPAELWSVIATTRLAILDRRFVARTARWPELMTALLGRAIKRSRSLAVQLAICNFQRVENRLQLLFWHLAERWGRVSKEGIVLPLELTHKLLASLVGARRPTVTTALKELATQGRVSRRADGMWILHGEPPAELRQLYASLS